MMSATRCTHLPSLILGLGLAVAGTLAADPFAPDPVTLGKPSGAGSTEVRIPYAPGYNADDRIPAAKLTPPETLYVKPLGKASATTASAGFPGWFKDATALAKGWLFPAATNKYGQKITAEDFFAAIIWIESNGVHRDGAGRLTKSWVGAQGFCQLMPDTARGLKVKATDPAQNLKGGAKYLREIFNSSNISEIQDPVKKMIMACAAYNMGPYSSLLRHDWDTFKTKAPAETAGYGIKLKMCLGFELTASEKVLAAKVLGIHVGEVARMTDEYYGYTRGIAETGGKSQ